MSFRGRGSATGANRGGFGNRGGKFLRRCVSATLTIGLGANEIFLIQAAEASSSPSVPPRRFSVITLDICIIYGLDIDNWLEMGTVMHACEGEMVCESINPKIPYFNAPIYLENKVRCRWEFYTLAKLQHPGLTVSQ